MTNTFRGSHISLFAGAGMTDLAAEHFGFTTIATAESDPWNRKLLQARFPGVTHFSDVKDVTAGSIPGYVREPLLISGGFPCQDISLAGHGKGLAGERSGLWSEFARVIGEFDPQYVLIENVAALRGRGLATVLNDLRRLNYNARWDCIPAAAVGAPHMRDRIYILASRDDQLFETGEPLETPKAYKRLAIDAAKDNDRMPRAGVLVSGLISENIPLATQRDVKAALKVGEMLLPSPSKSEPGWRNLNIVDKAWSPPAHPNQRFYDADSGRVVQKGVAQVATMFPNLKPYSHELFPTPRKAANEWRTTKNAPSHGNGHGKTLAGEANDRERAAGRTPAPSSQSAGNINPDWVEWLMGLPAGWTDPNVPNGDLSPFEGWAEERYPRTLAGAPERRKRLEALGNGLVPQAAMVALSWARLDQWS